MKYPFAPEVLDALPEELAELYRSLESQILDEICSRLNLADQLNEVTVQAMRSLRSHGISQQEIERAIRRTTNISEKKLIELLDDVVERNQRYYSELIKIADVTAPQTLLSIEDTYAIYEQTRQTFRNITQSMAFLVDNGRTLLAPARAYQSCLDKAILKIEAGATSYNESIKDAVRELADSGLKVVNYESGHIDAVDTAVRRAVLTGVNQLNQKYREQSMDYLGTDLVEVTAHLGARNIPGPLGFEAHSEWQGKVYKWNK